MISNLLTERKYGWLRPASLMSLYTLFLMAVTGYRTPVAIGIDFALSYLVVSFFNRG
jgi:hypothetical protein